MNTAVIWPNDPDWQMTALFLLALALLGFVMKLVACLLPVAAPVERPFAFWMLPSPSSVARSQPAPGVQPILFRILMLAGGVLLSYWTYWQLARVFDIRGILLSYLAAPILLLVSELLVTVVTLFSRSGGRSLPLLHDCPWAARSIADFWGCRWNLWFSDWFRYAIFSRLRRRPVMALFAAFAVSGLMHEWVINVPLYYVTGRMLFGTMMVYFLIQAIGIDGERRFRQRHRGLKRAFAWLVVLGPAPLVLNEGLLRTLHLWPE